MYTLLQHADGQLQGISVRAGVGRVGRTGLITSFTVRGAVDQLIWHGEGQEGREDELWRHGCFEVFVRGEGERYIELNLAPTRRWAAYAFDRYREGMQNAAVLRHRQDWLRRDLSSPRLEMQARWELPASYLDGDWRLNLSAVLETARETRAYWALAHPAGAPDFHDPACFAATLPAPDAL